MKVVYLVPLEYAVDSNGNYYELFNSPIMTANPVSSYFSSRGFTEYVNLPDTDLFVKSDFIQKNDSLSENIPGKIFQTRDGVDYFLSNFPIVYQSLNGVNGPQYDICWAASLAAIVRYEKRNIRL